MDKGDYCVNCRFYKAKGKSPQGKEIGLCYSGVKLVRVKAGVFEARMGKRAYFVRNDGFCGDYIDANELEA